MSGFDLASAKPVTDGFDLASAQPVGASASAEPPDRNAPISPEALQTAIRSGVIPRADYEKHMLAWEKYHRDKGPTESGLEAAGGLLEAPASAISGTLGTIGGGWRGLYNLIMGYGVNDAADAVRGSQKAVTYQPTTETGQALMRVAGGPGELLKAGGEKTLDVTGSPALATLFETGGNAALMAAGGTKAAPRSARPIPSISPLTRDMTPAEVRAASADTLLAHDIPLKTEQRPGPFAKHAGSVGRAADSLLGQSEFTPNQLSKFTGAILKKAGIDAKRATPDAMQELKGQVNAKYNDLTERVPTKIDQQAMQDLIQLRDDIAGEADSATQAPLFKKIDDITSKMQAGQPVTIQGRAAQNIRTSLTRMEQSANPTLRHFANALKETMDDAFERGAAPADAAAMKAVRSQFIKMKQIEGMVGDNGIITPAKAAAVMARPRNKWESLYGLGDQALAPLIQAGKEILPDKIANSGTPTRTADMAKVVGILTNPKETLKAIGTIFGGRMLNEARATRGTASEVAARNAARTPRGGRAAVAAALLSQQGQQ